jgi:prophage endopeptidase
MNRMQFVLATAFVLFVAFALGWFANWLIHRFTRVRQQDLGELDKMAQALHEAEEIRDQAINYVETRERDLTARIKQLEAEVSAAMDGVREARRETDYYRDQLQARSD